MLRAILILLTSISTWFRSRLAMQMELIALRHQVAVYKQGLHLLTPDNVTCAIIGQLLAQVLHAKLHPAVCLVWRPWKV